jgi:hypothetical protein
MTQDIGPEDETAQQTDEPVDEQQDADRRSTVWAWVAIVILILLLLLCLCQYFGAGRRGGDQTGSITSGVGVRQLIGEESPEAPDKNLDEGPVVPDVIGMTRSAAIAAVQAAGYRASVTDVFGTTRPANAVFYQNPSGGSRLDEGGTVGMLVQLRSRPTVTVPNLKGLTQAEAERRIRALGLEVVLSYAPPTGTRKVGRTYSQWPLPGEKVDADGEIQIQITIEP